MAKNDWTLHDTVQPEDMNALGEEMNGQGSAISALEGRLDNAEYEEITLQPGLQVINAKKDSRFRFGEMKGRTLVNLLGSAGDCETIFGWGSPNGTISVDTSIKDSGTTSLKYVNGGTSTSAYVRSALFPIEPTKHLIILAWIKNNNHSATVRLVDSTGINIGTTVTTGVTANASGVAFRAFNPTELANKTSVYVDVYSNEAFASGESFNFDSFRVYSITAEEYAALRGMSQKDIGERYPFVPSGIVGVNCPYVIKYGKNLLPPFNEWDLASGAKVETPFRMAYPYTLGTTAYNTYKLPAIPGQIYTLRVFNSERQARNVINFFDSNGLKSEGTILRGTATPEAGENIVTYQAPNNAASLVVYLYGNPLASGWVTFVDPTLNLGEGSLKEDKPRRDSMFAIQTELHASPLDGSDPDILFEKEAQYFKLVKWKKVVLNGSLGWLYNANKTGFKEVYLDLGSGDSLGSGTSFITKYNGITLKAAYPTTSGDHFYGLGGSSPRRLFISISNADSGWGDSYTPTADEIKAYFMGWRMFDGNLGRPNLYNGGGALKAWAQVTNFTGSTPVTTLPTTSYEGYTPYNLLYRLTKEAAEPVISEGALTLHEGENMVEVGTGIVLRERNAPVTTSTTAGINILGSINSPLKYKTDRILTIFKNDRVDRSWDIVTRTDGTAYGNQRAATDISNFDPTAAYSVTYLKLDKSPIQPIAGTLAANEKAQISDLTSGVAEALQRISVVEMKKVEKDAPGWIAPTLLNGWTSTTLGYKKVGSIVYIRGSVLNGAIGGTPVFKLPEGYRPKESRNFGVLSRDASSGYTEGRVTIYSSGDFTIDLGRNGAVFLDGVIFEAEQ